MDQHRERRPQGPAFAAAKGDERQHNAGDRDRARQRDRPGRGVLGEPHRIKVAMLLRVCRGGQRCVQQQRIGHYSETDADLVSCHLKDIHVS
jgi:hypothetical protein